MDTRLPLKFKDKQQTLVRTCTLRNKPKSKVFCGSFEIVALIEGVPFFSICVDANIIWVVWSAKCMQKAHSFTCMPRQQCNKKNKKLSHHLFQERKQNWAKARNSINHNFGNNPMYFIIISKKKQNRMIRWYAYKHMEVVFQMHWHWKQNIVTVIQSSSKSIGEGWTLAMPEEIQPHYTRIHCYVQCSCSSQSTEFGILSQMAPICGVRNSKLQFYHLKGIKSGVDTPAVDCTTLCIRCNYWWICIPWKK